MQKLHLMLLMCFMLEFLFNWHYLAYYIMLHENQYNNMTQNKKSLQWTEKQDFENNVHTFFKKW